MEKKKPKSRQDEIELAKSIFDEIVAETESDDWDKENRFQESSNVESSGKPSNNGNGVCLGKTRLKKS